MVRVDGGARVTISPKQQRFVREYLVDLNGTQAAIRAGYSMRSAGVIAAEHLAKPKISAMIAEAQAELSRRAEITIEAVLRELAKIGFANMADYMRTTSNGDPYLDFGSLTRDQAAALSEVTIEEYVDGRGTGAREVKRTKFKLHDKRAALYDIGRHLGMFKDKLDVNVKVTLERLVSESLAATSAPKVVEHETSEECPQDVGFGHSGCSS